MCFVTEFQKEEIGERRGIVTHSAAPPPSSLYFPFMNLKGMVNEYSYVLKYAIFIIAIMKEKQENNLFEIE